MNSTDDWQVGETLANEFRIMRKLGQGGMGIVYLVGKIGIDGRYAVKTLPIEAAADERIQRALARELQALVDLPDHPYLTAYRFFRTIDSRFAIFSEYIAGGSLGDWLKQKDLASLG